MDPDILTRRLTLLKRRPHLLTKSDDFLSLCIEDATALFLEYTNRTTDPGEEVDGLICELASFKAENCGTEYLKRAKDGEIAREYIEGGIPPMLYSRMNGWRKIAGL